MRYNNHLNYRDRRRLLIRLRIIFIIIALILVGVAIYFYIDYVRSDDVNTQENTTSQATNYVITPKINVFKSPFFQFQATDTWAEVPSESNANKFVYRSFRSSLLEHELVVYVNQIPKDIKPTRVFPVEVVENESGSEFIAGEVSEPCTKALDETQQIKDVQIVTMDDVTFLCYGKFNQYNVIVGNKGGDTNMTMTRPDGTTAVYSIYYKDLRAVNGPLEINQIIKSFQTR